MNNDSCRICKDVSKTIQHTRISSCPVATHTGTVILALLK
jgi:hypothetical protein